MFINPFCLIGHLITVHRLPICEQGRRANSARISKILTKVNLILILIQIQGFHHMVTTFDHAFDATQNPETLSLLGFCNF